ncbi:hypothetical protein OG357_22905 [Streptomyces sp. NBC_01255]|uniref:hypothetical protein n=1 Tax=Streptomyces sp. NBC_01255 TaxID=2903798 RepID=UPI002E36B85F|nr:hypothetical protein [Streptomyces sp. NBC_01255]
MPVPDARVELQIDGAWTDVTEHVVESTGIQLSYGRSDEGRPVDPGSGALTLLSPNGLYSNRNPSSEYFGKLPRNTPIRISATAGETFLRIGDTVQDRASTPDHASLDITGDIDLRFDARLDDWAPSASNFLMGKWASAPNGAWYLFLGHGGDVSLAWSSSGSDFNVRTSQRLPAGPGRRLALRVTLDVNNGAGGHTTTFYTAPTIAGPWTQLGPAQTAAGTTSIATNSTDLQVGDISGFAVLAPVGEIYAAEVRNGIGGTVVASPRFDQQAVGATSFVDSTGRTWTVQDGATLSDRRTRVVHAVPKWPATWHRSGHDVRAPIETAGILRRLGQGRKALASTLRRRIPSYSPLAYWPCEDGATATEAASPIEGVRPLAFTRAAFATDDSLAGSSALPAVEAGGTMAGAVPVPAGESTEWSVHLHYAVDSTPVANTEFFGWRTNGSLKRWRVLMRSGVATLQAFDFENILHIDTEISVGADVFTGWQRLMIRVQQSGSTITWRISWTNIGGEIGGFTGVSTNSAGAVTQVSTNFGAITGLRVGHIAVLGTGDGVAAVQPFLGADTGWSGEAAADRLRRLAAEEAQTLTLRTWQGDPARTSEQMGAQRPGALQDVLQQCADSDGGVLAEDTRRLALVYRDRTSLQNQQPVVIPYGALTTPFEPDESDLRLRNDVTVERVGGSSTRFVEEDGPLSVAAVGVYDEAVPLSLHQDAQTVQLAAWRLHAGTWDEARYPQVRIMLHRHPELIPAVSALQVGDRVQITGTPPWQPPGPVDLIVQRIDEDIRTFTWTVVLTCSPGALWNVGVLDSASQGRLDTDGTTLGVAVDADDTSMSFVSSPGPRWIATATHGAQFPFDVVMGGEIVRVTGITGTGLTQAATVLRSQNGIVKAHPVGTDIRLAQPLILAL